LKTVDESFLDPQYMPIQQAAVYVGVSVATLRRWDSLGRLSPVRHPVNGYRYYRRADLEPFRVEYRAAEAVGQRRSIFEVAEVAIEKNAKLREPQRQAYRHVREHFEGGAGHAILQIPVGCGKTGVIATIPFGVARGRVLVITPNTTIRKGVFDALDLSSAKCFWRKTGVLGSFRNGPHVAVLDGPDANIHDCLNSDFVVTNIQQLASSADRWLPKFPPNFFDMILVDEGHHNAAPSWRKVFERFPDAKVVSLTATPFRGDQKRLAGDVIYRYPFTRAMVNGYIKQIHSSNVAPSEIYFTYRGEDRRHSLDEVLSLREELWFTRGVALSPECNRHIVDASIAKWNKLRKTSAVGHQIIAVACSVDHARQVRALYEERGLRAKEIHSNMDEDEQASVLARLEQGSLDCIVQVQMLGEGFDHPRLSVAAILRPFRSLSPYIQFVGRIMRVIHESQPGHPDNQGYVVSHVGLNNDAQWDDFRELDLADQEVFRQWVMTEGDVDAEPEGDGTGTARRFDVGMQVQTEIIGTFINSAFLDVKDDRVLDQMLSSPVGGTAITLSQLGLTRETLRERLRSMQPPAREAPPAGAPVSPQRQRQTLRKRLAERSRSVSGRVLNDLGLGRKGWEVGKAVKEAARQTNDAAVNELLNRELNRLVGIASKERGKMSLEQAEKAYNALDDLGDQVRDRIKKSLKE
jgi:superfamily II DNA or RNA helicase